MYTFTANAKWNDIGIPSAAYVETILDGLKETYQGKAEIALELYLAKRILGNADDIATVKFVRERAHGVSVSAIREGALDGRDGRTKASVKRLVAAGYLVQDGNSVRAGHRIDDDDAVFYTKKEKRTLIDLMTM